MIRRVFLCHPKSITDAELVEFTDRVGRAFAGRRLSSGEELTPIITAGRDSARVWEEDHAGQAFNWPGWITHVVSLTTPFGGEPRYHYFVVGPTTTIGRATADLLRRALAQGRRVFFLGDDGALIGATRVVQNDPDNWRGGWAVAP